METEIVKGVVRPLGATLHFSLIQKGFLLCRPLCDCFYQDALFALKRYNHVLLKVYYYIIKNLLYPYNLFVYGKYNIIEMYYK